MAGLNKVILVGIWGPIRRCAIQLTGPRCARFSLATSRRFAGEEGQKQEKTEWHRIVVWRKLARCAANISPKANKSVVEDQVRRTGPTTKTASSTIPLTLSPTI